MTEEIKKTITTELSIEPKIVVEPKESVVVKELLSKMDEQSKQIDMLLQVADKKSLATYYSRNQKSVPKIVRLNTMDNKVIVSWKLSQNEVYRENVGGNFRWVEKQTINLVLADETELEMSYSDFIKRYQQVEAKILSKTEDENDELVLKVVRVDDGKECNVGVKFIN